MYFRLAISCLVLSLASAVSAQQPQNRIDLSVSEATPLPQGVASPSAVAGIAFRPVEVKCPEEHGTIEIRSGQIYLDRNWAGSRTLPGNGSGHYNRPLDDETYRYEIGNEQCRFLLHVRLQKQRDAEWQPASLPYWSRPSVSNEERSVHARELRKSFEESRGRGKAEPQYRPPPSPQMLGEVSGTGEALFFEAPSEATLADCFHAVGSYEIGQEGLLFTFLRALPGNLNRFVIERNDINSYQGRLFFLQDGCRIQLTFSGSWKYHAEWAPMTIDRPM